MTISNTIVRFQYTGNGVATDFAYTNRITDEDHLRVVLTDTAGVSTTEVITTNYTVTGVGDAAGGNVSFVVPPPNLYTVTIFIEEPFNQPYTFRNQSTFFGDDHEEAFDHVVRLCQRQEDDSARAWRNNEIADPDDFDPETPDDISGSVNVCPMTNDAGDGWASVADWPSAADIADAADNAADAAASAAAAAASAAQAAAFAGTGTPYGLLNVGLSTSVAASALTINLTQADGTTDPGVSPANVGISFRSSTLATGSVLSRSVVSALSIVVTSGATLGHNDALADYIYVYAIDNAGTVELAVSSSSHWDEGTRYTTTSMSSGADDAATLYSTTGRSNVAIRLIGRLLSTQTTAGTWASAITEVSPGFTPLHEDIVFTRAANFIPKHGVIYNVSTASARTISLPVPRVGWKTTIKDSTIQSDTNNITFARNGSEKIDNIAANYTAAINGGGWEIWSDGTDYFIKGSQQKSFTVFEGPFTVGSVTIPTAFASPTLTAANFTSGLPVTRSTNTLTFPFVGKYKITAVLTNLQSSSGTRDILVRLRNTTDSTTNASSNGVSSNNNAGGLTEEQIMKCNITDISKGFEFQWMSDTATSTVTNVTVGGDTGSRWSIIIESI
jgi:hypothetical protein